MEQSLILSSDLTVVWAPNSQGKTSLAEAIEFLLTGRISRRDLTASVQDEFAGALRNAHLDEGEDVYVEAVLELDDGSARRVRRILTADYSKREDCASRLEIDGVESSREDLAELGIRFSQPPLEVPVLAQHSLTHLFSVGPLDRATYFKSLLEVADLEVLRAAVAALGNDLTFPEGPDQLLLVTLEKVPALTGATAALRDAAQDAVVFCAKLEELAESLLEAEGLPAPPGLEPRLVAIEKHLLERQAKTFPMVFLKAGTYIAGGEAGAADWAALEKFVAEQAASEAETQRLIALFHEALNIPEVAALAAPTTCPLCETADALTPARVRALRSAVEGAATYRSAESAARASLARLRGRWSEAARTAEGAIPEALRRGGRSRRPLGFTVSRLRELLGTEHAEGLLGPWMRALAQASRALRRVRHASEGALELTPAAGAEIRERLPLDDLRAASSLLMERCRHFETTLQELASRSAALAGALAPVVAAKSATAGWQEFVAVARARDRIREGFLEEGRVNTLQSELANALRDIDRRKEEVLEQKFATHSGAIGQWWERLRPGSTTYFSALQPRKGTKRTIDLKAGLSPDEERSAPKVRDVIAVFSQSQLHCLGLALFLAKAEREGVGFIVLDDPVLANDDNYRVHFNTTVLEALLGAGIQVILLTQDHPSWEDIETRFRHRGVGVAQLYVESPVEGTVIENTSDGLTAKLNRADSLSRGGHPDVRKECGLQLRDAGERFCKEILVSQRRSNGDGAASVAEYDGRTLEWLVPKAIPELSSDPSHPGKLEAFKRTVNDACHDNAPPGSGALRQACGDLRHLAKVYLGL